MSLMCPAVVCLCIPGSPCSPKIVNRHVNLYGLSAGPGVFRIADKWGFYRTDRTDPSARSDSSDDVFSRSPIVAASFASVTGI